MSDELLPIVAETSSELLLVMSPAEIIEGLKAAGFTGFPEAALRSAQRCREEVTPLLIECLREATQRVRGEPEGVKLESNAHFFALVLLWEFQASAALPALIESLQLSSNQLKELYGDAIFDEVPRTLATLASDRVAVLEDLMLVPSLPYEVRDAVIGASLFLLRDGLYPSARAIEIYDRGLQAAMADRNVDATTMFVSALADAGPESAMERIEEAFRIGLVDEWWICLEDVQLSLKQHREGTYEELLRNPPTRIEDAVIRLAPDYRRAESKADGEAADVNDIEPDFDDAVEEWDDVPPNDPPPLVTSIRIPRNEPCPCGSGKKYKKCCGAAK